MDNTVINFVNQNHVAHKVYEQQSEAIKMVASENKRRAEKEAARKKQKRMSTTIDILLVVAFFAAIVIGFGVVYKDHFGPLNYQGQALSEMSPTEQLEIIEEVRQ